jgi:hypothetical protein
MTEAEWLAWGRTNPMLQYLIGADENQPRVQAMESFPHCRSSDRKLRLFACACYHRISHLLPDRAAHAAVAIAERFADGLATDEEFRAAEEEARGLSGALEERWRASRGAERAALQPTHAALALAGVVTWREAQKAAYYAASNAHLDLACLLHPFARVNDPEFGRSQLAEEREQCRVLRDIFGNPFRPVTADPRWLTSTVLDLARLIYDERSFDRLPILADALMDAGCDAEELLNHCRGEGPHVRGCWAVDLLLGKS